MEAVQIEAPQHVVFESLSGSAERVDINKLLPLIKLRGEGYNPIKKAHIYCQVAHRVRRKKLTIGDQFHDMRIHVDTALHMGGGKRRIKEFHELWTPNEHIDTSGSVISPSYLAPTDIWKEQLVGKVDKYVTKKGEV